MVFPSGDGMRPLALCVGVAILTSVSVARRGPDFWKRLQCASASPFKRCYSQGARTADLSDQAASDRVRFLPCTRQLEHTDSRRRTRETISVVQMNILARNLATRNHFPYVVDSSLNWENRKMTLLNQLVELDADVLCLEELSDYWTFFKPELDERGYDSVYVKRPSIHVSNWSGAKKLDGCGIFFKKDKFELKECESINFHDPHDRVAMLAVLKLRHFAQFVLIGCTHLWWNAKKVEHQMAEVYELEEEVLRMTADIQDKYHDEMAKSPVGTQLPVVLCGDFNNSPESTLYNYMETSFLQTDNVENLKVPFKSAYAQYKQNVAANATDKEQNALVTGEPPHTTVNYRRCWTIDYLWYSNSTLVPTKVLEIPSEEVLRAEDGPINWLNQLAMSDSWGKAGRLPSGYKGNHNGIPNSRFGSDHVPIMAEFELLAP